MVAIRPKFLLAVVAVVSTISLAYMYRRVDRQMVAESRPPISRPNHANDADNRTETGVTESTAGDSDAEPHITSKASLSDEPNGWRRFEFMREKVFGVDSRLSVPMFRPSDSRLLYPQQIRDITAMTIDHKCDADYGANTTVVILVISRVDGHQRRSVIRNTWAERIGPQTAAKLFFAIGLTGDQTLQKQVLDEDAKHGDLLQWNFVDNYYNLTIKSLAILRWTSLSCFDAQFIYKVDDDCIVNVDALLRFCAVADRTAIYGYLWRRAFVDRNPKSKFFISRNDYPGNAYPDYTGGPWLVPTRVVPSLYETAVMSSLPALPYEDVYVTGVVAAKLAIKRKHLPGLVLLDGPKSALKIGHCLFNKSIIFWQYLDDSLILKAWSNVLRTKHKLC